VKTRIGSVCDVLNGFAFKSENYVDSGIRVIRITNVQKGFIEDRSPQFYPTEALSEISKYVLLDGDLLLSLTGNVGRPALIRKILFTCHPESTCCLFAN
jgi:type I restriction enzyme S subunit